jgi:hypothetical protein
LKENFLWLLNGYEEHDFSNEANGGVSDSKSSHKPEHKLFHKAFNWARTK